MITRTIENQDNKIKLKADGHGRNSDVIKEVTFLIDHTDVIYDAVVDQLPPLAQLQVFFNALDTFKERKGE